MLDTDTVFHGVDRVTDAVATPRRPSSTTRRSSSSATGAGRCATSPATTSITYDWDDLRFSVSWKAYCFADEAARDAWRTHADDLTEDEIVDRLVDDLTERGVVSSDVARDPELGLAMMDTYIRFPV